jgi:hypothetical protein
LWCDEYDGFWKILSSKLDNEWSEDIFKLSVKGLFF